jgi:uncharacterized protein (TIGR03032 family)
MNDQNVQSNEQLHSTSEAPVGRPFREVRFEYTPEFPRILQHLRASLLISTYQAGKLAVVGVADGRLTFSFHNFEKAMGLAAGSDCLAIGTRREIFFLRPAPEVARTLEPADTHDACWLARSSFITGNIHGHELAWGRDGLRDSGPRPSALSAPPTLWVVNTLFSTLCTLDDNFSFVPRWRPPFIQELIGQDRCHLNGLAMHDGFPKFVTAMAESNEPAGWRPTKATSGCVIDVESGQTIARGFAMPHSPRLFGERLWVLNSGAGALCVVDPASGGISTVETFPGYTRGLAFQGQFAFVGLSKIRETSVFGGVPIAEKRHELRCGVGVVDLVSGRSVAALQFHSGVDEVFAVDLLPGCTRPFLNGPTPEDDGQQDVWIVPPDGHAGNHQSGSVPRATGGLVSAVSDKPATRMALGTADTVVAHGYGIKSVSLAPESVEHVVRRAAELQGRGNTVGALEAFRQAIALAPQRPELHNDLGNVWQELGDQQQALASYRRAIELNPEFIPARQNLGYLLFNHGEPEQALEHYERALAAMPTPMNQVLAAGVLPVVYDSATDVDRWRERLTTRVRVLADDGVRIDTTRAQVPTNFFLAYQGRNDCNVMRDFGRVYQGVELCRAAGGQPLKPRADGRLRVGFLSAYFRDHTIGRLNLGRVRHLSRKQFEVTVLSAGRHHDDMARAFERVADRFVAVPRQVETARQIIADQDLDVLIFADVGMDALTSTLAYSRMAPVQCVTWGHPDTTGSPAMDYFLSSDLLEPPGSDEHFTEQLVRLPLLGIHYERPRRTGPPRSRAFFGLDESRHVYLCPQTLFKFHPDFDVVLAGILNADPQGDLILLEGRVPNWTERLKRRFARTLPDAEHRVRFLPAQPRDDFLALLMTADVLLDPLHFGGGNTSYEALAVGTPIVTWPSPFLRGRITAALYAKMKFTELIVDSADDYIRCAVQLGTQRDFRQQTGQRICETSGVLFEDADEVRVLESFLWSLT